MPVDLLLRNGLLADGRRCEIAIDHGRFVAIDDGLSYDGRQEVDLEGRLVLSGLTDVHHHVDKAYTFDLLGGGDSLLEAVQIMRRHKPTVTVDDVYQRAKSLLNRLGRHGVCAIRTHVDLDDGIGLRATEAVLALRQEYADRIRMQVVAFPRGDADLSDPTQLGRLRTALAMGCDVIGGTPTFSADPYRYVDTILGLAREFHCLVDLHVDEAGIPSAEVLEYVAEATLRAGLVGRVTASHCCTLAVVPDAVADRVIARVKEAKMTIATCPLTNLLLQGGGERVPGFRGLTRVQDLLHAGVNVCCGSDNVRDPFNPYGNGDPVLAALVAGLAARLGTREQQEMLMRTITESGAQAMHLPDYGLAPGCRADLIAVDCPNLSRVLVDLPGSRIVVLNGRLSP